MNKQEIFNKVVEHARTQKQKAINKYGSCRYRTEDGLKCFVGALIPDDKYDPVIEGINPFSVESGGNESWEISARKMNSILTEIGYNIEHKELLLKLQSIHDSFDPSKWEDQLKSFANKYNLTYNPPSTANQ